MSSSLSQTHFIVLPGGGYAAYAENEADPIVDWLALLGIRASVLRYPLNAAGGHLAGHAALSVA
jgi:hypothetical protein